MRFSPGIVETLSPENAFFWMTVPLGDAASKRIGCTTTRTFSRIHHDATSWLFEGFETRSNFLAAALAPITSEVTGGANPALLGLFAWIFTATERQSSRAASDRCCGVGGNRGI